MRIIKCEMCGIEISTNNSMRKYCIDCRIKKNKELSINGNLKRSEKRRKKLINKKCIDCGLNISYLHSNSKRCIKCACKKVNNDKYIASKNKVINLKDSYIISNLKNEKASIRIFNPSQELIDFTREHIRLKRLIKELKHQPS